MKKTSQMDCVPQSERKHIVITGRSNVGKSSMMNALIGQDISIVGDAPGKTTESVKKPMELHPYGPVILIDTSGIDDASEPGTRKLSKTIKAISGADFVIVVIEAQERLNKAEKEIFSYLEKLSIPYLIAVNKIELGINGELLQEIKKMKKIHFEVSCKEKVGITEIKTKITRMLPSDIEPRLLGNLVKRGDIVVMVVPSDICAPKGRLVMSQVQTIREALDEDTIVIISKDKELRSVLDNLKKEPKLVVTDSPSIMRVTADLPDHINLTTFSILIARYKGELSEFVRGIKRIEELQDGNNVLIAEACTHHSLKDDIGHVKISQWLRLYTNKNLNIEVKYGEDFPDNLSDYKLIIHCNGCILTRHNMLSILKQAKLMSAPIINYGVLISYMHGAIPKALLPFEEAVFEWKRKTSPVHLQL
jgi:[FeFe] hydrogenase H-cluster maturation GTPase HydF